MLNPVRGLKDELEIENTVSYKMPHRFCYCRCLVTTIDPETGIKTGEDPLKTLKT